MRTVLLCLLGIIMLGSPSSASDNIENALRTYLKEHYPWPEIEIKELYFNRDIPQREIRDIFIDRRPPGKAVFTIHFKDSEKVLATANIKAFEWVVMSRRPQGKGYILNEEDLYRTLMDVTKIPRGAVKEINEAAGMTLRHSIIANSPLTKDMLAAGGIIKKDKRVVMVIETPAFVITSTGKLMENGYIGSLVKAINTESGKTVRGILINENTLKVGF